MASELEARPRPGGAVADFRRRLVAYEDLHPTLARVDLHGAAACSLGAVVLAAAIWLVLPSPQVLRDWDCPLAWGWMVFHCTAILHAAALPLAAAGAVGLVLDGAMLALRRPRLPVFCHVVCAVQPVIVIAPGVVAVGLVLALFWVFIVAWLVMSDG